MDSSFEWADLSPEELVKKLEDLKDTLLGNLERAAVNIGEMLASSARRFAPRGADSRLSTDIGWMVEQVADVIIRVRVGSKLPYAEPQEFGTVPFFPPPDELVRWARLVLGAAEPRAAAFLVARSIATTGLEAREYFKDAVEDNVVRIADEVRRAVDRSFRQVGIMT